MRWDASGTAATELGNLGTDSNGSTLGNANAINTAGTAVGGADKYVSGVNKGTRAVRWDASGTAATELGNLGTDSNGSAPATPTPSTPPARRWGLPASTSPASTWACAVRWDASGTAATELANLGTDSSGFTVSNAYAVNTAGTAVGVANKFVSGSDKGYRAVRWDASGTAATELGNLGTDSSGFTVSYAFANNTAGTAVGYANKYVSGSYMGNRAVRRDASGTAATELGNLGTDSNGYTYSQAYAINTSGIAVGVADEYYSNDFYTTRHAVVWGLDGVPIDLNSLIDPGSGWMNGLGFEARGISDTNWVTGYGWFDPDGPGRQAMYQRLFLLNISSVVPEPTGLSILALAVPALLRRRKRVTTHM